MKSPANSNLSRRMFLAGTGTLVALPFLESLLPRAARAAAATAPKRLALFHMPCGIVMNKFTPQNLGTIDANFALSPTLSPLDPVRDYMLVLSNMQNDAAQNSQFASGQGLHSRGQATLFTGANLQVNVNGPQAAISLDQIYAQSIMGQTPVNSLQLGVQIQNDCDADYACQDIMTISWSDATTPLTPQTNPQQVFDSYFGTPTNAQSAQQAAWRRTMRKSVLDTVSAQATALQSKMGSSDKQKLDQYFTSVRSLEVQLSATPSVACGSGTRPAVYSATDYIGQYTAMMDLMALAFTCDLTRSISFTFGAGHCDHNYSFLPGITDIHHSLSHNNGNAGMLAQIATIEQWEMSMMARFYTTLKNASEDGGNVLDNTVAITSSELADGNLHNFTNLGVLVVGKGGGFVKTARHVQANTGGAPYGNTTALHLGVLQGLGVPVKSFGQFNTTTPLAALSA